jgi:outer membrane protein assembly factor BamB
MSGRALRHGVIACAMALAIAPSLSADARGLWLLGRKDSCNTARADVAGDMKRAPREVWSYGFAPDDYAYLKPVGVGGKPAYFAQVRAGLRLVRPNGTKIWQRPTMGVTAVVDVIDRADGKAVALVTLGTDRLCLVDVATGKTLWSWTLPSGSYLGGYQVVNEQGRTLLIVFPQNSMLGLCFDISATTPKLLWEHDYTGRYWANFGPFFVLADMDNDGAREIVLIGKPGYAGVIDIHTGAVKFDLQYDIPGEENAGRPYGLISAVDVDGDGYRDIVVVSCQVEEYISVLHNNAGKSLSATWARFVSRDYPVENIKMRPNTTSVADVNGDGRKELVLGLFNDTGDGRWHTLVFDTMKGYNARLADLPDRYFWGCRDLDGDGRPEIVTSIEKAAAVTTPTGLQAVDGRTGKDIAAIEAITAAALSTKPPLDTIYRAMVTTIPYMTESNGSKGLLVGKDGREYVWRIAGGKSVLDPIKMSAISRVVMSSEGTGRIGRLDLAIGNAPKATPPSASGPLVAQADGKRELILSLSDGTVIGGTPDLLHPGRFSQSWTVPGAMPSAWIGPKGERLVCTVGPGKDEVAVYRPTAGKAAAKPVFSIRTPVPVSRYLVSRSTEGLLPFGKTEMKLFVGLRPGVHAIAGATYDSTGKQIWYDKENGPYPRIAAAADLNGDGSEELVVDNHGRHSIYDSQGHARTVAVGWSNEIPGRSDGAKYAVPIVGPFGLGGAIRIIMAGGLDALETLDANGNRVGKCNSASAYEFQWCGAAVAKIRGTGDWDVGTVNGDGVFYCSDANTCQTRWTLPLGAKATTAINISSGDVDGDGRDNFLVGLANGDLLALDEKNGKGFVLWKVTFDAGVKEAVMADVDGDGIGELIVDLDDGRVKVLK